MNISELKKQIAALSAKERFQLATFLDEMQEKDEADYQAELGRRMKAMDAGKKVTEAELLKRHKELCAQGR